MLNANHIGRLDYIDALRGLAALLVVLEHIGEMIGLHPLAPKSIAQIISYSHFTYFNIGRVGVVAFFIVSGFVIPFSFRGKFPRINFIVTRFFRLYPAYWLSLGLALLILPSVGQGPFTTPQALANITMFQLVLHQDNVVGAYWTLLIELIFYCLCFVAFSAKLLGKPRFDISMAIFLFSLAAASAYWRHSSGGHGFPVGYLRFIGLMFMGALLRRARLEGDALAQSAVFPLLVFCFLTGIITHYLGTRPNESIWGNATGELFGIALFIAVAYIPFHSNKLFLFFGKISYSLYLFHGIFLYVFRDFLYQSSFEIGGSLFFIAVLGSSIVSATLCFKLIETPSIDLGRKISQRLQSRMSAL